MLVLRGGTVVDADGRREADVAIEGDEVGRVAEGYRADLVVLDGNPLDHATVWGSPARVVSAGTAVR
ncbi:hypothetical protein NGM10_02105 [Halorussus salilacus]|uniref:hypothetical protein n=1 Tax=Halorussus salilacus TaxID=2953750 RepID=UPI0020A154A2|nr:hypothetical protein [Halorussus salilacus]USZ68544.1 hypothetical protein NGM10_02105 [Halorussus salilacus]